MLKLYRYTDKELKEILSSIVILVDTREKKNQSLIDWLERKNKPYKQKKLDFADYSFYVPKNEALGIMRDLDFSKLIVIERKQNIEEFLCNLSTDRARIEKEFALCPARMEIVIENCQYKDIRNGNYKSKYKPESALGTLHSWKYKYGVDFQFMQHEDDFPLYMYLTFQHFLKNHLK